MIVSALISPAPSQSTDPQAAMDWEPVDVFLAISATCASIFLLYLPVRLWELRVSGFRVSSSWQGVLQSLCVPILHLMRGVANLHYRLFRVFFQLFYLYT